MKRWAKKKIYIYLLAKANYKKKHLDIYWKKKKMTSEFVTPGLALISFSVLKRDCLPVENI